MSVSQVEALVQARAYDRLKDEADVLCEAAGVGPILTAAIRCKIDGQTDTAFALLQSAVSRYPDDPASQYEFAIMFRDRKQLALALRHAELATALAPRSFRLGLFFAHMLFANGAWTEGHRQVDALVPSDADEELERLATKDFGNYLCDFPRGKALYLTEKLRTKYHWMSANDVAGAIRGAVGASDGHSR